MQFMFVFIGAVFELLESDLMLFICGCSASVLFYPLAFSLFRGWSRSDH